MLFPAKRFVGVQQGISLISRNNEMKRLLEFIQSKKEIYIFGAGKIGNGIKNYLKQSEIDFAGFVTSNTFDEFRKVYKQGKTGLIIGLSDIYLDEIMPMINSVVVTEDLFLSSSECREIFGKHTVEFIRDNLYFYILLTPHCNLSCKSCISFSPVNRADYYEKGECEKDIKKLEQLTLAPSRISISGGEPFLHPDLLDIIIITRNSFPEIPIYCCTNGSLLDKLKNEQLKLLIDLDVTLIITEYPPVVDKLNDFYLKADNMGIKYECLTYENQKLFNDSKFNLYATAPMHSYFYCATSVTPSLQLYKGKIYGCSRMMFIPYFNERFKTDFQLSEGDYIDIYNTTPEEIYKFKISRKPFCRYHDRTLDTLTEWGISERKLEEWVHLE